MAVRSYHRVTSPADVQILQTTSTACQLLVACAGFEPARQKAADFKSAGSTYSPNRPTRLGTAPSGYGLLGTADGPPEFAPIPMRVSASYRSFRPGWRVTS